MRESPALALLSDLIRAAPDADAVLAVAKAFLVDAGADVVHDRDAGTLVARSGTSPTLAFSGHVDVVPDGAGWVRDPHGAEVLDGRLWGRGACDMLGSIAAFLPLAAEGIPVGFVLTTDEETTMGGARVLVESGALDGFRAIVVGEPTDFEIGFAEKGVLWLDVEVSGEGAHASMPHLGRNAILGLAKGLAALDGWAPKGHHPALGEATTSIGIIEGGTQANVVPDRAHARLDVRYLPGQESRDIVRHVEGIIAKASGLPTHAEVLTDHVPFDSGIDSSLMRASVAGVENAGHPVARVGLPYGTEASRFQALDVDLVVLGPGERALAHTNRESIALADLDAGVRMYRALLEQYAGNAAADAKGRSG